MTSFETHAAREVAPQPFVADAPEASAHARAALSQLQTRIAQACERVRRAPQEVALVGASKTVSASRLREFFEAGLRVAGENYVQEGVAKRAELQDLREVSWHLIGALQSNKAREAVRFDLIHSVDRDSLARALNRAAETVGKVQDVLLQVNLGDEESKSGCAPQELPGLIARVSQLPHLRVRGLMCLPPFSEDSERTRPFFQQLRRLRDELLPDGNLSMGMSNDFEVAIQEGATMVRVGTALFGTRQQK